MAFSRAAGKAFYHYGFGDIGLQRIDLVSYRRRGPAGPPTRFLNAARRLPLEGIGDAWTCRQTRP